MVHVHSLLLVVALVADDRPRRQGVQAVAPLDSASLTEQQIQENEIVKQEDLPSRKEP